MKRKLQMFLIVSIFLLISPFYLSAEENLENNIDQVSDEHQVEEQSSDESKSSESNSDSDPVEESSENYQEDASEIETEEDSQHNKNSDEDDSEVSDTESNESPENDGSDSTYDGSSENSEETDQEASENLNTKTDQQEESENEPSSDEEEKQLEVLEEDKQLEDVEEEQQDEENSKAKGTTFSGQATAEAFPYKYGDEHSQIVEIKQMLNAIGFDRISETDYFGNWTETRVEQFQANYGLTVSGEVDRTTFDKLAEVYNSPFQVGESSSELPALKEKLNSMGFDGISVTDYYGNWTATRVGQLQDFFGLKRNGIADAYTRQLLDQLVTNGYQQGDRHFSISNMKEKLNAVGFDRIAVTDYYGNWTETRVLQFQENYNLNPTGNANKETLDKLNEVYNSPFQQGSRHDQTIELKEMLNTIGYGYITVTDLYGSFTETQVKRFQNDYGLKNNGIADELTRQKIKEQYDSMLKLGDSDSRIIEIKDKLNSMGFNNISATDYFGGWTETRVKQFQSFAGLAETGSINSDTIDALDNLANQGYGQGDRSFTISNMKEKLNAIGFNRISETNYYGNWTETRVRQFQNYYGLTATGKANKATLDKLDAIYNNPFQEGKTHSDIIELKNMLNDIGYGYITVTDYYGSFTETQVKKFQNDHGLKSHGIADNVTWKKIDEIYNNSIKPGESNNRLIDIKQKLNSMGFDNIQVTDYFGNWTQTRVEQFQSFAGISITGVLNRDTIDALNHLANHGYEQGDRSFTISNMKEKLNAIGFDRISVTNLYGSWTETRVRQFQEHFGLSVTGKANKATLDQLETVYNEGLNYTQYDLTLQQALNIQMNVNPQTDKNYAYVSADFIDQNNRVSVDSTLNVRSGPGLSKTKVGSLSDGARVNIISEINGWYQIEHDSSEWKDAARSDVLYYLNPSNFLNNERERFQFLDLSRNSNATANLLNDHLSDKGILADEGQSFIEAGNVNGVNDVYLMSHAILETGHGGSELANGIDVGKDQSGNLELVTDSNRSSLTDIETTYNMYGIGAVDDNAKEGGAFHAYNEGWFTPEKAIIGGAAFIGNDYVKAGQNTLYKMRWNPESMDENGYASHQYATDIGWAFKQVSNMYNLYRDLGIVGVVLDIPKFLK